MHVGKICRNPHTGMVHGLPQSLRVETDAAAESDAVLFRYPADKEDGQENDWELKVLTHRPETGHEYAKKITDVLAQHQQRSPSVILFEILEYGREKI